MDGERWGRVKELFTDCLELAPDRRTEFLHQRCDGDTGLIRDVQNLLTEDSSVDGYMVPPAPELVEEVKRLQTAQEMVGNRVGAYRLERIIGQGGMASVFLAARVDVDFEQKVAIKLLKRGMDTDDIQRRFRTERQVLADLVHPGIARLLDGGATEDGLSYLVMEVVDGQSIDRYCDAQRLGIEERLCLFQKVCAAVDFAHERRVIHRDLKPSNILVTGDGQPKLLDFGIAKLVDATGTVRTVDITATELRLMTPEYASPEQVSGGKAGPASDVYSLGVILYELLSGHRPYRTTTLLRRDLERAILQEDPLRPSQVVHRGRERGDAPPTLPGEISAMRRTETRRLRSRLVGDLDTIVMMALRKEPERRYGSPRELADDIERSLTRRPVLARPDTWRYRAAKFVRRNRVLVVATAAVFLALVTGLALALSQYFEAEAERARAEHREYVAHVTAAGASLRAGDAAAARRRLASVPEEARGWEWRHFWARSDRSQVTLGHQQSVDAVAWSTDGRHVATSERNSGKITLWDAETGEEVVRWKALGNTALWIRFLPDTSQLLVFVLHQDTLYRLDPETASAAPIWKAPLASTVGFHAASDMLASGHDDGRIRLWTLETSEEKRELGAHDESITALEFSPDGNFLVSRCRGGVTRLWQLDSGESWQLPTGLAGPSLDVDPTGRRLAAGDEEGVLRVFDLRTRAEVLSVRAHAGTILGLSWDGTGDRIATCATDRTAAVWNAETGTRLSVLLGHSTRVRRVRFSPDSSRLASASWDRTAKIWSADADDVPRIQADPGWVTPVAASPDGAWVATAAWGEGEASAGITVWDIAERVPAWRVLEELERPRPRRNASVAWSPDGRHIAAKLRHDPYLRIWDARTRVCVATLETRRSASLAFSPDGTRLALGGEHVSLWNMETFEELAPFPALESAVGALAFGADGRALVTQDRGDLYVWDVATRELRGKLPGGEGLCVFIAFRPDGRELAAGARDGSVRFWSFPEGELLGVFPGHSEEISCLAYSPDGRRLATGARDRTLMIWDGETHEELVPLHGHAGWIKGLAFGRHGETIYSIEGSGELRIWDTGSGD